MYFSWVIILCINLTFAAIPEDICDRCVIKEKCDVFLNLNARNQQSWMEKYSCHAPSDDAYSKYYEFAPTGQGDFICCGTTLWGTEVKHLKHRTEDIIQEQDKHRRAENDNYPRNNFNYSTQEKNQDPNNQPTAYFHQGTGGSNNRNTNNIHKGSQISYPDQDYPDIGINFNINNGVYYANPMPLPTYRPPFMINDPANQNQNNNGNINIEEQCLLTSFPPKLEEECCGKEASDDDRIIVAHTTLPPANNNISPNDNTLLDFTQEIPAWLTSTLKSITEFGKRSVNFTVDNRIAGGKATELHQFPWTVHLTTTYDYGGYQGAFTCGGSLISSRYVLTAGHCVYDRNGTTIRVEAYLAEYDKRTFPTDCKVVFGVGQKCVQNILVYAEQVILHSQFEDLTLRNDIALIRLGDYAPYTEYIRPICLPSIDINDQNFSSLPLTVAGWGRNGTFQSDLKQSTVVNLVPPEQCVVNYPYLSRSQICAAGYSGEDTCKGDSGGPLMTVYRGKYVIVGVVSGKRIGSPCGSSVPSLYTNVFDYLDWIRSNIRN